MTHGDHPTRHGAAVKMGFALGAGTIQVAFLPTSTGATSAVLSTIATMLLEASLAGTGVAP